MSAMSVNVHAKNDENFKVSHRFYETNKFGHETYGTIQLQGETIDVCVFVEESEVDLMIKQLQALKRKFKKNVAGKLTEV